MQSDKPDEKARLIMLLISRALAKEIERTKYPRTINVKYRIKENETVKARNS